MIDEGLLFGVVEAARHRFRLAIVKAQAMQQGDQPRAAVAQPECPLQPSLDLPDASGTIGVDPIAESDILLAAEAAGAAVVVEGLQRFDPASLKSPMPVANRVVIQQQGLRDARSTMAFARRATRCSSSPSRASPIRARRSLAERNPSRIMPPAESHSAVPSSEFGFSMSRGISDAR